MTGIIKIQGYTFGNPPSSPYKHATFNQMMYSD